MVSQLVGMTSVPTIQGTPLAVTVVEGQIVLDGVSTVTIANVVGSNGTVHVVNAVSPPPA